MNKKLVTLSSVLIVIAECWAGRVPVSKQNVSKRVVRPFLEVDPLTARSFLNNNFESGTEDPWYDSSPNTVHWVVEDFSAPTANYPPPAPLSGTKYLRATRNAQLTSGQLILRTVIFTALPGDVVSFDFWIRSRYTGGNTLDLVLSVDNVETTLISLTSYSTSVNLEWRPASTSLLGNSFTEPTDVTLIFYAYCGGNIDDAIAIDNIVVESNGYSTPATTTTAVTTTTRATTTKPTTTVTTIPTTIFTPPTVPCVGDPCPTTTKVLSDMIGSQSDI